MEPRTKAIVLGAIGLFVIVLAAAAFYYVSQIAKNKQGAAPSNGSGNGSVNLRLTPVALSPTPSSTANTNNSNTKLYQGQGFYLRYPSSWGLLTCNGAPNFEFDPISSVDQRNVACDYAVKPVTFLVNQNEPCRGDTVVSLGGHQVVKSKSTMNDGTIQYRWCLSVDGTNLDITHRVSPSGGRATSKEDFSSQVEQVISTIQKTPAAS